MQAVIGFNRVTIELGAQGAGSDLSWHLRLHHDMQDMQSVASMSLALEAGHD
jgi:hypothetical protein